MLLGGALVWLWCGSMVYRHGRRALASRRVVEWASDDDAAREHRVPIPGAVLVLCGLAAWMIQPMGAALALALAGPDAVPDSPHALRESAVGSLGAYVLGAALIAGMVTVIPGVWRAIGAALRPSYAGGMTRAKALVSCLVQSVVWAIGAGLAVYVVGALSVWGAQAVATWRGTSPPGNVAHTTLSKLIEPAGGGESGAGFLGHDVWWWGTVLGVTVGAPIIEEFIYRGFIQSGVLRLTRSGPVAVVLTSLMFAMAHWSAVEGHALVTLFVLSLCFGMAMEKTGRLWVPILMHAAFNIGNILMAMG